MNFSINMIFYSNNHFKDLFYLKTRTIIITKILNFLQKTAVFLIKLSIM